MARHEHNEHTSLYQFIWPELRTYQPQASWDLAACLLAVQHRWKPKRRRRGKRRCRRLDFLAILPYAAVGRPSHPQPSRSPRLMTFGAVLMACRSWMAWISLWLTSGTRETAYGGRPHFAQGQTRWDSTKRSCRAAPRQNPATAFFTHMASTNRRLTDPV